MIDSLIAHLQDGIYHILQLNAYDHILFLTVLMIPYVFKDWKRIFLLISAFTFGHCMSLLLASYGVVSVNNNVITFLTPLIILIVAFFNILTAGKKAHHNKIGILVFITLFLGLVHGLGFVNQLNDLISTSETKWLAILEIALGMVIGQLVIAFIVVFISFICQTLFRFSKRDWIMVISAIILGCLLPILVQSKIFS